MSKWLVKIIWKIVVTKLLLHLHHFGATGHVITKGLWFILMINYATQHVHWWNALRNDEMHSEMVKRTPNLLSRNRMPAAVHLEVVPIAAGVWEFGGLWVDRIECDFITAGWGHQLVYDAACFPKFLSTYRRKKFVFKAGHSLGAMPKYL